MLWSWALNEWQSKKKETTKDDKKIAKSSRKAWLPLPCNLETSKASYSCGGCKSMCFSPVGHAEAPDSKRLRSWRRSKIDRTWGHDVWPDGFLQVTPWKSRSYFVWGRRGLARLGEQIYLLGRLPTETRVCSGVRWRCMAGSQISLNHSGDERQKRVVPGSIKLWNVFKVCKRAKGHALECCSLHEGKHVLGLYLDVAWKLKAPHGFGLHREHKKAIEKAANQAEAGSNLRIITGMYREQCLEAGRSVFFV